MFTVIKRNSLERNRVNRGGEEGAWPCGVSGHFPDPGQLQIFEARC